ncbi:MAG: DMT family transporter [Verrucomicrobia bacterium]|nr:DMT family transporter [Verrucomicrobiota bacterium]
MVPEPVSTLTPQVNNTASRGARPWLVYAIFTTIAWGVWGALIEIPEKAGFPATLGYAVWAFTMVPCAAFALWRRNWKWERDRRSLLLGAILGLTGAAGQLVLFEALRLGPAYLVFPVVSLYPALTIAMSCVWLKESASRRHWVGIILALPAIALLSTSPAGDSVSQSALWVLLAAGVFIGWGVQAFFIKLSNNVMSAESVFLYITLGGLLLVPVAVGMTDFERPIYWGLGGPYLAVPVHLLNSLGTLALVYALRHGKAIIVVPMTALAPVITVLLSLALYHRVPLAAQTAGIVLAMGAVYLLCESEGCVEQKDERAQAR